MRDNIKFSYWLWFTIIISFTPLLWSLWDFYFENNPTDFFDALGQIISNGELVIICVPILSGSIGEIFKSGFKKTNFEWFTLGGAIFAIVSSVHIYSKISGSSTPKTPDEIKYIMVSSMYIVIATILLSFSAFMLARVSQNRRYQ